MCEWQLPPSRRPICSVACPPGHDGVAQASLHAAVQPEVGDGGQLGLQQVVLHDVQHAFELAEDEHAVLRHHRLCAALGAAAAPAQAAVQKQLVKEWRQDFN